MKSLLTAQPATPGPCTPPITPRDEVYPKKKDWESAGASFRQKTRKWYDFITQNPELLAAATKHMEDAARSSLKD